MSNTENGTDDSVAKLKRLQTTALSNTTRRKTHLILLMDCDDNLHSAKHDLEEYNSLFALYQKAHADLCVAIKNEDHLETETQRYCQHEMSILQFKKYVTDWIYNVEQRLLDQVEHYSDTRSQRTSSSRAPSSRASSCKSTHTHEKAKLAALLVEQEMLSKMQAIELQEKQLKLELEIKKSRAREQVFAQDLIDSDYQDSQVDNIDTEMTDGMNEYLDKNYVSRAGEHVNGVGSAQSRPVSRAEFKSTNAHMSHDITMNDIPTNVNQSHTHNLYPNVMQMNTSVHGISQVDTNVFPPTTAINVMSDGHTMLNSIYPVPAAIATNTSVTPINFPTMPTGRSHPTPHAPIMISKYTTSNMSTHPTHQPVLSSPAPFSFPPYVPTSHTTARMSTLNPLATPYQQDPLHQLVAAMTLPHPEIPKFNGNPMEYSTFMMAFTSRIESRTSNNADRLYFLDQLLEGEAKDVIGGCLHMEPFLGYIEAKSILQREYGDPYKIATSYTKKVLSWPIIKHDTDLKCFSIFLTKCRNAMLNIPDMGVLNHIPNLQAIVSKLPNYLQNKWRDNVNKLRYNEQRLANFQDLSHFVHRESETANDPVFGKQALTTCNQSSSSTGINPSHRGKSPLKYDNSSSFAVNSTHDNNMNSRPINCKLCNQSHDLDRCSEFLDKSIEDRRSFLKDKNLCFACFGWNHTSRGCLRKRTCNKCGKKHPTSLHMENFIPNSPEIMQPISHVETTSTSTSTHDNNCFMSNTKNEHSVVLHAIIPVNVWQHGNTHSVLTYAFYDNGSSGCFMTNDLMHQLEACVEDTSLTLRTMHGKSTLKCTAIANLIVSGIDGQNPIEIPRCFTRD